MKDTHRERAVDELEAYDMNTDIFSQLDKLVVRMEKIPQGSLTRVHLQTLARTPSRSRDDTSMQKLGRLLGEEDEPQFASPLKVQEQKEEPAVEKPAERKERDKVRDHFPERE